MSGLEDVFTRLANDPSFADAIRTDPTGALSGYKLTAPELRRVDQALGTAASPPAPLFQPTRPQQIAAPPLPAADRRGDPTGC